MMTFFIYTSFTPIPLDDYLAASVRDNPQVTNLVVSFIGTVLGGIISFLFCHSACYAINTFLIEKGMPFYSLLQCIKIASGKFIWDRPDSPWAFLALVVAIALVVQPAAITSAFTPSPVTLSYPITGQELDLTNPAVYDILGPPITEYSIDPSTQPDTQNTVFPSTISSGEMGVRASLNLPSFFSFNNYSYVEVTNGILPANLVPMSNIIPSTNTPLTFLPANAKTEKEPRYRGQSFNYTMTQQEYQPRVTCRPEKVDIPVNITESEPRTITADVTCDNNNRSAVRMHYTENQSPIFVLSCPVTQGGTDQNALPVEHDIHLIGHGPLYESFPDYICRVNSDVVILDVHYGTSQTLFDSTQLDLLNFTSSSSQRIPAPRLAYEAVSIFVRQVISSQGPTGNMVGNIASAFYAMKYDDSDSLTKIWTSYLEGSLQFASTLIRTTLTSSSHSNLNITQEYPHLPIRTMNGTYRVNTLGWTQSSDLTHRATFAAPIFLVVSSMLLTAGTFI
ncbi:hypothetical protein AMATHDRAFT_6216 [Amanita thiersii Skay4041]|uniref:Uncharacterized protein n=1 Tax=Amanita thiersii Skay4041 TaxID=703135 RepID=A0A2A9NJZ1_9AGAR|nr:hypothetical protein AMATHDRAFT_6216 [Amanita thiersii Skay4041]